MPKAEVMKSRTRRDLGRGQNETGFRRRRNGYGAANLPSPAMPVFAAQDGGLAHTQSHWIKVNQSSFVGHAGSQIAGKRFKMNGLQNIRLLAAQTMLNLVNHAAWRANPMVQSGFGGGRRSCRATAASVMADQSWSNRVKPSQTDLIGTNAQVEYTLIPNN
jgi:hypothetical protein